MEGWTGEGLSNGGFRTRSYEGAGSGHQATRDQAEMLGGHWPVKRLGPLEACWLRTASSPRLGSRAGGGERNVGEAGER